MSSDYSQKDTRLVFESGQPEPCLHLEAIWGHGRDHGCARELVQVDDVFFKILFFNRKFRLRWFDWSGWCGFFFLLLCGRLLVIFLFVVSFSGNISGIFHRFLDVLRDIFRLFRSRRSHCLQRLVVGCATGFDGQR